MKRKTRQSLIFCTAIILVIAVSFFITYKAVNNNDSEAESQLQITAGQKVIDDVQEYASVHGYSMSDYPARLLTLLENHPDSADFVMEYPKYKDKTSQPNMKEYTKCSSVPLFIQWDQRWGYAAYGDGIVGLDGCGPTCLSMCAVYYLQDTKLSPDYIADYAYRKGYYKNGVGSTWDLFTKGGTKLGLTVKELPLDETVMKNALQQGDSIILSLGEGDFTTKGHFIVVTGYTNEGFKVNDPNSYKNSDKLWTYERLSPQIKNLWSVNK